MEITAEQHKWICSLIGCVDGEYYNEELEMTTIKKTVGSEVELVVQVPIRRIKFEINLAEEC